MSAVTAQQAALRVLLDEVDPLIQRAEDAAQILTRVREELNADLQTLGGLVQRSIDAQPLFLEVSRKLQASANRIESAADASRHPETVTAPYVNGRWRACAAGVVAGALLVGSGAWWASRDIREQARIGRAVAASWTNLDLATKARLQDTLNGH